MDVIFIFITNFIQIGSHTYSIIHPIFANIYACTQSYAINIKKNYDYI